MFVYYCIALYKYFFYKYLHFLKILFTSNFGSSIIDYRIDINSTINKSIQLIINLILGIAMANDTEKSF